MNNPCADIFDGWYWQGYDTSDGCDICGNKPAKIEPRFGYVSCAEHSVFNPIRFSNLVAENKSTNKQDS